MRKLTKISPLRTDTTPLTNEDTDNNIKGDVETGVENEGNANTMEEMETYIGIKILEVGLG